MSSKDIFSKHLPNVKLTTKLDADGFEIPVEIREDEEQTTKQLEIFDILVAAGYFRAKIKGISPFDKLVGGMTWCIEACDFDVDIDLLFHENLIIGQKIALTEKIVAVLIKMKCPFPIEPHQIQGLDFINIFPVIQWLVKRSFENRAEKAERLKTFACGQFHNYFQLKSDVEVKERNQKILENVQRVRAIYGPKRLYRRKYGTTSDDEATRVRITLLEYGDRGISAVVTTEKTNEKGESIVEDGSPIDEIDVEVLLNTLSSANEEDILDHYELTASEKEAINQTFAELKSEMAIDSRELSEQNKIKSLLATKTALKKKLERLQTENQEIETVVQEENDNLESILAEQETLKSEINALKSNEESDKELLEHVKGLVEKNEKLKQDEMQFKEKCRQEAARLQTEIEKANQIEPIADIEMIENKLVDEQEKLQTLRLQLAKQNRAILSVQKQLDNIPDRTELAQYQRRFIELYNQVSATHKETKQFYALYNTLDDTKLYLTKELTLLNSIYENYNEAMQSQSAMDEYLKQFERIVESIRQNKTKVKTKSDDEKAKSDGLNEILLTLVEQERKYAAAIKQLTRECQRNENLQKEIKMLER